ncbi:mucin-13b [Esox lucius]|uniref:SEA domain-containing protein n=1 Tax=Esox lucius TaxID=8010 RepID=A0A6Q2XN27_ESOLU|nr:mucin-13b [Esox lucius]
MTMVFVGKLILFCCLAVAVFGQSETVPTMQAPSTETPSTKTPATETPSTKTPATETPSTKTPATETPSTKTPATETPSTKTPATETPATETPATETPSTKTPATETPSTETPATETPSTKTPATETPSTKTPATETPSTKTPATETPSTKTPATAKPDACSSNPCKGDSSCRPGFDHTFTCVCRVGQIYLEEKGLCEEAKVFPGSLTLATLNFDENMRDPASKEFFETASKITTAMKQVLQNRKGYLESIVLTLRPVSEDEARTMWKLKNTVVKANLENIFKPTTDETENKINQVIKDAIQECNSPGGACLDPDLTGAQYQEYPLCAKIPNHCEEKSALCDSTSGIAMCTCLPGYIKTIYSNRSCKACESGKKAVDAQCVDCSFGYSGFNCDESWKLILVIVGTILSALLLITLILLAFGACKTNKKSSSQKSSGHAEVPAYTSPYPSKDVRALGSTNGGAVNASSGVAGFPKIPRAMSNSNSWDRGSNLEMTESGSRQALVPRAGNGGMGGYQNPDNTRNINTRNPYQSGGQSNNPYQSGGQSNNPYQSGGLSTSPYQSGGQDNNPYLSRSQDNMQYQSRGQDNPYFTNDNGRRY